MAYLDYALIEKSTLGDIGDAIREKTGGISLIDPANFASEIENIPSATDEIALQEKTVTENGEVLPDEGYYGLRKVMVDVDSECLLKTVHLDSGESTIVKDYINNTPVVGLRMMGTTIPHDFTDEETLYNPRAIDAPYSFQGATNNYMTWKAGNSNSQIVYLPGTTNGFFGVPVSAECANRYLTQAGNTSAKRNRQYARYFKDSKDQHWICDEIDMESGMYYRRTNKLVFDGSADEIITKVNTSDSNMWNYKIQLPSEAEYAFINYQDEFFCDRLPSGLTSADNNLDSVGIHLSRTDIIINIGYYMSVNTVEEVRNLLSQYPIALYYVLPSPIGIPLMSNLDNEVRLNSYKKAKYVDAYDNSITLLGSNAIPGTMVEFSYAIDPAGLAVALGCRENMQPGYKTQMDRLYRHFEIDRVQYPYCMIVMPKSVSSGYRTFRLYFNIGKFLTIDYSTAGRQDQVYIGDIGINGVAIYELPDDLNDVSKVVDFVIDKFTKADITYTSTSSHYTIDYKNYIFYTNSASPVYPSIELDVPFDGAMKFPKVDERTVTYGDSGQVLVTDGNGSVSFASLPKAIAYDDQLYEYFGISKAQYPYMYIGFGIANGNKRIIFAEKLESTSFGEYSVSGYIYSDIPVGSSVVYNYRKLDDLDYVVRFVKDCLPTTHFTSSSIFYTTKPVEDLFPGYDNAYHFVNIEVDKGLGYHHDLRQLPILTSTNGVRFSSGGNGTAYDYGTAGQVLVTNGDGTVSFIDGTSGVAVVSDSEYATIDDVNALLSNFFISVEELPENPLPNKVYAIQGEVEIN